MKPEEYEIMYRVEDRHWWYVGLRGMIQDFWGRHVTQGRPNALDVGCGTGAVLSAFAHQADATGIDMSLEAIRFCRGRGHTRLAAASAVGLPFAPEGFDVVMMFDVLCHRNIVDKKAPLREIHRILKPQGILLMNLPAYQWLHSSHDVAVHSDHRFTKRAAVRLLKECSFDVIEATYWNTLPFPPILLVRLWRKIAPPRASDLGGGASVLASRFLRGILAIERHLIRLRPMPFGLSIFLAARKA